MHFTVRLPEGSRPRDVDVSLKQRVAHSGPADRGRAHLGGPAARRGQDRVDRPGQRPSTTPTAFPEVYKQAVDPADAINDIAIIEELQDNSVKLVFSEGGEGRHLRS